MALFPMFVSLEGKKVLVIGGGTVAFRKIEKLLPFQPDVKVISKDFSEETMKLMKKHHIPYEKRAFKPSDLQDQFIVIVAVDDIKLQEEIFRLTRDKNIFVNAVDSPDYCDFIFPAYVKKEDVVIGITSSGSAPGLSAKIRKHIEKNLPENLEEIVNQVKKLRESLPKGKERQKKVLQLVEELFKD